MMKKLQEKIKMHQAQDLKLVLLSNKKYIKVHHQYKEFLCQFVLQIFQTMHQTEIQSDVKYGYKYNLRFFSSFFFF